VAFLVDSRTGDIGSVTSARTRTKRVDYAAAGSRWRELGLERYAKGFPRLQRGQCSRLSFFALRAIRFSRDDARQTVGARSSAATVYRGHSIPLNLYGVYVYADKLPDTDRRVVLLSGGQYTAARTRIQPRTRSALTTFRRRRQLGELVRGRRVTAIVLQARTRLTSSREPSKRLAAMSVAAPSPSFPSFGAGCSERMASSSSGFEVGVRSIRLPRPTIRPRTQATGSPATTHVTESPTSLKLNRESPTGPRTVLSALPFAMAQPTIRRLLGRGPGRAMVARAWTTVAVRPTQVTHRATFRTATSKGCSASRSRSTEPKLVRRLHDSRGRFTIVVEYHSYARRRRRCSLQHRRRCCSAGPAVSRTTTAGELLMARDGNAL
jgi:hypothetical protein